MKKKQVLAIIDRKRAVLRKTAEAELLATKEALRRLDERGGKRHRIALDGAWSQINVLNEVYSQIEAWDRIDAFNQPSGEE